MDNNGDAEEEFDDSEEDLGEEAEELEAEEEGNEMFRRFLPIFQGLLASRRDDPSSDESEESVNSDEVEGFDRSLPGLHSYLGSGNQVSGRTILEEDELQKLPLIPTGFILMPGQVFPLTVFHPAVISLIKNILGTTKTFGVANLKADSGDWKGSIGTTAEIFEYRDEDPDDTSSVGFKFKARGRQRFKLMSVHREIDGNLTGTVEILPEVKLRHPLHSSRLRSCDRQNIVVFDTVVNNSGEEKSDNEHFHILKKNVRRNIQPLTPFPAWLYDIYDDQVLASRLREELRKCGKTVENVEVPKNPEDLSWWVAINLPFQDSHKLFLLSLDCCVQRMRAELSFLSKGRVFVCQRCDTLLGEQADMFSMCEDGPQVTFSNPGGHLHETLTLHKARNLRLVGMPSTEYSWFPGYAWTILECGSCFNHIGWKFTAAKKHLKPEKFYGLSRKSITAKIAASADGTDESVQEDSVIVI